MTGMGLVDKATTVGALWDALVRQRPHHEFLVHEDCDSAVVRRYTYAEFDDEVTRCIHALRARGIGASDQVVLYLGNCVEFITCFVALAKMGAVVVPVEAQAPPLELARIMQLCNPRALILHAHLIDNVLRETSTIPDEVIVIGDSGKRWPELAALMKAQPVTLGELPDVDEYDVVEILYTSGTTSAPKGVMITHANILFSGRFVNWELDMNASDRYLTTMVAARVNFQLSALAPVLTSASTLILVSSYSARRFWSQVRHHRATLVQGMAMIVTTLLRQPPHADEQDHCVRNMHYFLPLGTQDKERFEARYGVRLLNNYGSTETLVGVITDQADGERRWPSIGRIGPGYDLRIVGEEGHVLGDDEIGELHIRGVAGLSLMKGYFNDPESTREVLDGDGWYNTHDYAYTSHGWVYFVDRRTDLIKRNGESISSAEVEDILTSMPGIAEAAVVGVDDDVRGQAVRAYIVRDTAALSSQEIIAYCARRLASYKVPTQVRFIDALPRGNYGKVKKNLLTQM
ncbi:AMP-binding protein [Schaalia suimastitidis]|uniref:AMP-binding protein n=1 Tax=Schaalia suimastitidis TaxID=121163 RepID=UPI00040D7578|nr:AMP-binding protein [Schaalia suimastitidis]